MQLARTVARTLVRTSSPRASRSLSAFASTAPRSAAFAELTDADISFFRSTLNHSEHAVLTDPDDVAPFNTDWLGNWQGASQVVLKPSSTEQVSQVLAYCNDKRLAVVPQGGNTGLVGGSVPLHDEVVLSLSALHAIHDFDAVSGIVTCDAGVVLETLDAFLRERGHIVPLDLGAKGSCHIGGNASTNAGGIRYLRYGSLHGSILGLEVVLADGTVLDGLSSLRKDNTGYDLKQLFIGAEGTLGVITKLSLLAPQLSPAQHVAYVGVRSFEDVLTTLREARASLGEVLSAIEFVDRHAMDMVLKHLPGARDPLAEEYPFYVLVETAGSNAEHDEAKLMAFLEKQMTSGPVQDGVVAQDEAQIAGLWMLREGVAESLRHAGVTYKYDVSLPTSKMYDLVETMRERIAQKFPDAVTVGYGHLGDSNLHLNVSYGEHSEELLGLIEPFLFEQVRDVKGSVSAEHGVGQCKVPYLGFSKSPAMIATMRKVKQLFDPNGILNPYKVLPEVEQ